MKALRQLQDIPIEELRHMPRCNVEVMCSLSPAVRRDPNVIEAAQNQREKEFVRQIQEKYPNQHVELQHKMILSPMKSARELAEQALTVAKWVYDVRNREDALENVFAYFMDGRCEREGFSGSSNREAFDLAKQRGVA
jgi:hypothetical protein